MTIREWEILETEEQKPKLRHRLARRFWLWKMKNPKDHILVTETKLEDEGTWGSTDFDYYLLHPDRCYDILDVLNSKRWWEKPIWQRWCDIEEFIDTVEPRDWPKPPFEVAVHVESVVIRGFDYVEHDAWLEPIDGWKEDG